MSARVIARRYARALFELIQEGAKLQEGLRALAAVAELPEVRKVLLDPVVSAEDKAAILTKAVGDLPPELVNLTNILCSRDKAVLLPEIAEIVDEMILQSRSEVVADVVSATQLDAATQEKIADALSRLLGREVRLQTSVDKSLIGGLVIRIGDRLIDYSIRNRLLGLRKAMVG